MSPCKFCKNEIIHKPITAVSEVAQRIGFCNWVCWDRFDPIPEHELERMLHPRLRRPIEPMTVFGAFCGLCDQPHSITLSTDEFRSLIRLSIVRDDGRIMIGCDECAPMKYSNKHNSARVIE